MRRLMCILVVGLVAGCGEPIKGIDEDAKAAKAQTRDAVNAAEDAAKRVDELSRQVPADPTKPQQEN